jgi:hypothetical protein
MGPVRGNSLHPQGPRSFDLIAMGSLGLAVLVGMAIGQGMLLLALLPATFIAGLVIFVELSLAGWCGLLLLLTVVSRGVVMLLGLPDVLNFIHYPAALAFAVAAAHQPRPEHSRLPASRWIAALLLLTLLSSVANATNPLRGVMFVVIVGEPILVIWAIQRWGVDAMTEARVGGIALMGLLMQIPLGLWQGSRAGWLDSVQGTLVGHGAGAHILGGLFALGLFIWLASVVDRRHSPLTGCVAGGLAIGMMGAAGAVQVILLAALALPAIVLFQPRERSLTAGPAEGRTRRGTSRIAIALLLAIFVLSAPVWAGFITSGLSSRATDLADPSQREEVILARERLRSDPLQFLLGSGPGTSASRAALLLAPSYLKPGSLFVGFPLEATPLALEYSRKSKSTLFGGSAESAASSMLGVIGDLGILGLVCLSFMFIGIYRAANRVNSWLLPAMAAALIMTFGLSFIDNWLEYPEFSIPLAILVGFGTTTRRDSLSRFRTHRHGIQEASVANPRGA